MSVKGNWMQEDTMSNDSEAADLHDSPESGLWVSNKVDPAGTVSSLASDPALQDEETRHRIREVKAGNLVVGWSRFIVIIPIIGLLVSALVLTITSIIYTGAVVGEAIQGELGSKELLVEFVELADIYLLSVVLYVMSLGLYSLFISDNLPLPHWLEFHTLNDLKEKLIAIVGVALAVYFFGRVVGGEAPLNVLLEGVGIAAIIVALAYFMKHVLKK